MEKQSRTDLKINGSGSSTGGVFNKVKINGEGRITGGIECDEIRINGVGNINGSLKTKKAEIYGEAIIKGNFSAQEAGINGHAKINGNCKVQDIHIKGGAYISNSISTESIKIEGEIQCKGDCNSEKFQSKGAFSIDGLLNSGEIDLEIYGKCTAKEIGGENIKVKRGSMHGIRKFIKTLFYALDLNDGLITDLIEGDEIYLEHTKAKVVRGNNIFIGEECEIELVEYKNKFENSGNCRVKENKKI
jgi:cytoskeletal protein CcmA (bactofilin family)